MKIHRWSRAYWYRRTHHSIMASVFCLALDSTTPTAPFRSWISKNPRFTSALSACGVLANSSVKCSAGMTLFADDFVAPIPTVPRDPIYTIPDAADLNFRTVYVHQFDVTVQKQVRRERCYRQLTRRVGTGSDPDLQRLQCSGAQPGHRSRIPGAAVPSSILAPSPRRPRARWERRSGTSIGDRTIFGQVTRMLAGYTPQVYQFAVTFRF